MKTVVEPEVEAFLSEAPLFFQPWWLDLVTSFDGWQWGYAVARRGQEIAAVQPYTTRRWMGCVPFSEMPRFTPYLGPWLRTSTAKYSKRLGEEKDLMEELIAQLPDCVFVEQHFHPSITNWLPYYWKGFQQTTLYTYRIEDAHDPEQLWGELRENVRTDIKKARKLVQVEETDDFSENIRMQQLTLARQRKVLPHSEAILRKFGEGCALQKAGRSFIARDAEGRVHASIYLVWDKHSVYYLTGGGDPELRNSGAASLLIWHGIEWAGKQGKSFDFEGSVLEPIERFFRAFGARQTPYFAVTKDTKPWISSSRRMLGSIRKSIQRARFKSKA